MKEQQGIIVVGRDFYLLSIMLEINALKLIVSIYCVHTRLSVQHGFHGSRHDC